MSGQSAKPTSKWIDFHKLQPERVSMKTDVYRIHPKERFSVTLGFIKWYGPWRKYCFFPEAYSIFENQCMGDIIAYINYLMESRKANKKETVNGDTGI